MPNTKISLGKIISAHGVKGLFSINLYNKNLILLSEYLGKVHVLNKNIDIRVKFKKGNSIVCESKLFKKRDDLNDYIGKEIWIKESDLNKIDIGEFYHKDIIGCEVLDSSLQTLGKVKAIHNFGAGELLELNNSFKYMIRFYALDKNKDIDLNKKKIILNANYEF